MHELKSGRKVGQSNARGLSENVLPADFRSTLPPDVRQIIENLTADQEIRDLLVRKLQIDNVHSSFYEVSDVCSRGKLFHCELTEFTAMGMEALKHLHAEVVAAFEALKGDLPNAIRILGEDDRLSLKLFTGAVSQLHEARIYPSTMQLLCSSSINRAVLYHELIHALDLTGCDDLKILGIRLKTRNRSSHENPLSRLITEKREALLAEVQREKVFLAPRWFGTVPSQRHKGNLVSVALLSNHEFIAYLHEVRRFGGSGPLREIESDSELMAIVEAFARR